jgi:hypothetical protein
MIREDTARFPVRREARLAACSMLLGCPLLLVGCQNGGPSTTHFGVIRLTAADRIEVFQVSRDALLGLGFEVATADLDRGRIESLPAEENQLEFAARSRAFESGRRQRRVASVRIESRDGEISVFCRVEIQEPSTEAHRFRASVNSSLDRPGETPIERDAATTPEQNTVWRAVGRDRDLERSILDAVRRVAGSDPDVSGA